MKKILSIGELLIDFIPKQKGCSLDEVTDFERVAGGAPANVVTAAARLGLDSAMISQVGMDAFGTHILNVLKQNGVDTSYIFRTSKANTGLAFVSLDKTGNREFSFYRNPSADLFLSEEQITEDMFKNAYVLHFCSVDLVEMPVKYAHKKAIELAKKAGAFISFDPNVRLPLWNNPEDCQNAIGEFLPYADIIKLSDDEIEFVTGCKTEKEAAQKLLNMGCTLVLITRGSEGSAIYTKNSFAETASLKVNVVDTTGAGDSFIGSLLYQLTRDNITDFSKLTSQNLENYLKFSAKYASLTVSKKGAVMATLEDM